MGSSSPSRARLAAEMGPSSSGSRGSCAITGCSDGCAWAHLQVIGHALIPIEGR